MHPDNTSHQPLTEKYIRQVLGWWRQTRQANSGRGVANPSAEEAAALLNTYYRLMEIYCTVKAGGVNSQIEAAQALLAREKVRLEADMALLDKSDSFPNQSSLLKQEILELERAASWRIAQLKTISPEEERAVVNCLPEIEAALSVVQD